MVVRLIVEGGNLWRYKETTNEWKVIGKMPEVRKTHVKLLRMRWLGGAYLTPEQQEREKYDTKMKTA